jgi:hypothetical protein
MISIGAQFSQAAGMRRDDICPSVSPGKMAQRSTRGPCRTGAYLSRNSRRVGRRRVSRHKIDFGEENGRRAGRPAPHPALPALDAVQCMPLGLDGKEPSREFSWPRRSRSWALGRASSRMGAPRALLNLALAGFTDRRETFWELAKRVACLRQHNMAATDILVHTNMDAGHTSRKNTPAR